MKEIQVSFSLQHAFHVGICVGHLLDFWVKIAWTPPAPPLVGVETNPGPGEKTRGDQRSQRTAGANRLEITLCLKEEKLSNRAIAKKLGVTERTVSKILMKETETGTVHDRPRSGRKRKITEKEEKKIIRSAKKGKSAPQIAREFGKKTGKLISEHLVRRKLKKYGKAYLKVKKIPKLNQEGKNKRVKYCRDQRNADWKARIFLDEKTFWLGTFTSHAWQDKKERLSKETGRWTK